MAWLQALPLNYLPQDEFWAGTLGFLSYRVPMLGREVRTL